MINSLPSLYSHVLYIPIDTSSFRAYGGEWQDFTTEFCQFELEVEFS